MDAVCSFETGPLGDVPDNASYSSQHFKALGRAETFDVALRMWRMDTGKAQEQYEDVLEALPGVDERDEIASRSLRTIEKQINGVAFLDGPRGIVILLTCGSSLCSNSDVAVEMGKLIHERIKQLAPNATAPPPNTQVQPTVPVTPEGDTAPVPDEGTQQ